MPSLFTFGPYVFFFWMGENGEPVHVHVALKRPRNNATKYWLTSNGSCILANNNGNIPKHALRGIERIIIANHTYICNRWTDAFGPDSLRFYY